MRINYFIVLFCLFLVNEGKKKKKSPLQGLSPNAKSNLETSNLNKQPNLIAIPSLLSKSNKASIGKKSTLSNKSKNNKKKRRQDKTKQPKIVKKLSQETSSQSSLNSKQNINIDKKKSSLLVLKHLQKDIRNERNIVNADPKETSLNNELDKRKSTASSGSRKSNTSQGLKYKNNKNKQKNGDQQVVKSLIQAEILDAGGSTLDEPNKYAKLIFLISIAAVIIMLLLVLLDQYLQWRKRSDNINNVKTDNAGNNQIIVSEGQKDFKTKFATDFGDPQQGILKWKNLIKKIEEEVKECNKN